MKFLILLVFLFGCNYSTLGEIHEKTKIPTKDYVLIDSNGGVIVYAYDIGESMKEKTCVVKKARNTTFQVILPYCKERYYLPDAKLSFRSAGLITKVIAKDEKFRHLSEFVLRNFRITVAQLNNEIIEYMINSGIPLTKDQIYNGMMKELTISGDELKTLHPWILPISECSHCPK